MGGGGTSSSESLSRTSTIGVRAEGASVGDGGKRRRRTGGLVPEVVGVLVAAATASRMASVGRSRTFEGARLFRLARVRWLKRVERKVWIEAAGRSSGDDGGEGGGVGSTSLAAASRITSSSRAKTSLGGVGSRTLVTAESLS